MKTATLVLGAIALVSALAVLAGCGGGNESAQQETTAIPFDQAFIDAMVPHHQEAIAAAQEAKDSGLSQPELIEIADAIIATQQTEIDEMLAWRQEWFGSSDLSSTGFEGIGMSMEDMGMQHDPADIGSAADVDAAFASMMVDHHNGAIAMAQMALERGEHPEIRELAQAIIDAQRTEVEILEPHASGMHHG